MRRAKTLYGRHSRESCPAPTDCDMTLMHNHYHCIATDPFGLRVDFIKDSH